MKTYKEWADICKRHKVNLKPVLFGLFIRFVRKFVRFYYHHHHHHVSGCCSTIAPSSELIQPFASSYHFVYLAGLTTNVVLSSFTSLVLFTFLTYILLSWLVHPFIRLAKMRLVLELQPKPKPYNVIILFYMTR